MYAFGGKQAEYKLQTCNIFTWLTWKLRPAGFRNKNTSSLPHPRLPVHWMEPFVIEALWGICMYWGHIWPSTNIVSLYYNRTWLRTEADPNNDCVSSDWQCTCLPAALPSLSQSLRTKGFHAPKPPPHFPKEGKRTITVWVQQICITSCLKYPVLSTVREKNNSVFALKELSVNKRLELYLNS